MIVLSTGFDLGVCFPRSHPPRRTRPGAPRHVSWGENSEALDEALLSLKHLKD